MDEVILDEPKEVKKGRPKKADVETVEAPASACDNCRFQKGHKVCKTCIEFKE